MQIQSNESVQIRLGDLIYTTLKRWKLIAVFTLVGLLFGFMLSVTSSMHKTYNNNEITCSFVVTSVSDTGGYPSNGTEFPAPNDVYLAQNIIDTVKYIMRSDLTLSRAIESLNMIGVTPREIRSNFTLTQYSSTQILEAKLTWRDGEEGVQLMNAILDAANTTLPESMEIGSVTILNPPTSRYIVSGIFSNNMWMLMSVVGAAIGIAFVFLELLLHPTLTNLNDVETVLGLDTFGVIPVDDSLASGEPVSLTINENIAPEVYQNFSSAAYILRSRIERGNESNTFYVTSSVAGEGKTIVAANLAVQLASMERKVLLVDLNTRAPTLGSKFIKNLSYEHSLNALYYGDANQAEAITTLSGYLDILPMVLERKFLSIDNTIISLIRDLAKNYDYVIIDAAPVGQVSGTLRLNQVAGAALFVAEYDSATMQVIRESLDKLSKSGTPILGCIVNKVKIGRNVYAEQEPQQKKAKKFSPKAKTNKKNKKENEPAVKRGKAKTEEKPAVEELSVEEAQNALLQLGLERRQEEPANDSTE